MDATKEPAERRRKTKAEPEATTDHAEAPQLTLDAASALPESANDDSPAGIETEAETAPESEAETAPARPDRRRIEEQLEALKRKESELRRALAVADHPEIADAVRLLEGRAYAVASVEAKMAQGLSKSEERRLETLQKKLASLREKRAELDGQIAQLEAEAAELGEERTRAFEAERGEALQNLMTTLSTHEDALRNAGLDAAQLVPDIARLMPEIVTLAERLVATTPRA